MPHYEAPPRHRGQAPTADDPPEWALQRPLKRAARHDGVFPIDLPGPEALAEIIEAVGPGKEVVVTNPAGTDPTPWAEAGATWCLTGFGPQPTRAEVERAIDSELR